jgi:Amt family ammonium transporter
MSNNIFLACKEQAVSGNQTDVMQCVSNALQEASDARTADLNDFLYVVAGAMIFFMQAGFAMLCAGSVRLKNVQNTMLKNLLDASGAALAFFLVGKSIAWFDLESM